MSNMDDIFEMDSMNENNKFSTDREDASVSEEINP